MSIDQLNEYSRENHSIWSSPIHGLEHWERVWSYGQTIGWSVQADMEVVHYFAYLHDCARWDDGVDLEHGPRAAFFAKANRELFDLSEQQFQLLLRAVSGHTAAMPGCKAGDNPTLATCWDADRLDIDRVGIAVEPKYLFTELAQDLAYLKLESDE